MPRLGMREHRLLLSKLVLDSGPQELAYGQSWALEAIKR
jgi:hypothetical protein